MISVYYKRVTGTLIVLATATLICACAGSGPRQPTHSTLRTIPLGSTVQVIGLQPEIKTPDARTAGETVAMGAAGTAIDGAAAGFEACAETEETIRMCPYVELETKLEIVPPDEAHRALAELRQTIYGKTEK